MATHAFTLLLLLCAVALVAAQQDAGAGQGFNGGSDTPARPGANGGGRPPFQGGAQDGAEGSGFIISILILKSIHTWVGVETALETDRSHESYYFDQCCRWMSTGESPFFLFSPLK
jgi:hypothetical protein